MSLLIKLLPFLLLAFLIWNALTANARMTRWLMRHSRPLDDWSLLEPVRGFSQALGVPPFTVRVLDMEAVNGLALPGGEVFISRGLYEKFLSGQAEREEVVAVIAHEIGHVALGHHRRRMSAWRRETAALALLWVVLSRVMLGWVALLAVFGLNLYRNQMTQRDEFEADAFAAQIMMRSQMDPHATISLLSKLQRWNGQEHFDMSQISWLLSHPPIPERIAHLRAVIEAGVPEPA
ncbi:MAG: M48 family metallopeptidase [Neomegalonema sp.]|nr:M48 family metallopeptidase [Neomegalonema sp.]